MNKIDIEIKKNISKNLKKIRTNRGYTQQELSEKAEISESYLKRMECGEAIGSVATLVNLCIALETTPNMLLSDIFKDNINDVNINNFKPDEVEVINCLLNLFDNRNKK